MAFPILKQLALITVSLATGAASLALLTSRATENSRTPVVGPQSSSLKRSEGRAMSVRNEGLRLVVPSSPSSIPSTGSGSIHRQQRAAENTTVSTLPDPEQPTLTNFERTEDEFSMEARDPRWAADNESAIVTIAQRFPQTRASDVECRTKHCRLVVTFPGVEEYNAMFRGIAEDAALKQSGMTANIEGTQATIYISRRVADDHSTNSRAN